MTDQEKELDLLLALVEERVDLDHCREVEERHLRTLAYEEGDLPPLVILASFDEEFRLPAPFDGFRKYSYGEGFYNPVAMLQNEILTGVAPGVLLKDDNPLPIRNNHGSLQVASVLGATWRIIEDQYPWVEHFDSLDPIREIAAGTDMPGDEAGELKRSFETLRFYHEKLREHPNMYEAIHITLPDLQGPMDTAEQLWGSGIYLALYDEAELLERLLARAADVTRHLVSRFNEYTRERLVPRAVSHHGYIVPGGLLIKDDSSIVLSPEMYAEFVLPHLARLLREVGKGSIHFCGDGSHLIEKMVEIPDLLAIDPGQSYLFDIHAAYETCRERKVAMTGLLIPREDLVSGKAVNDFPTGCGFLYEAADFEDAREVLRAYRGHAE